MNNNLIQYVVGDYGMIQYKSIDGLYVVWGLGKYGFLHGMEAFKRRK